MPVDVATYFLSVIAAGTVGWAIGDGIRVESRRQWYPVRGGSGNGHGHGDDGDREADE